MSEPNNQPTILIKKADGSFARVSIAEFQKMQAAKQSQAIIQEEKKIALPKNEDKPITQVEFQNKKPERPKIKSNGPALQMTGEDMKSLLEESAPAVSSALSLTSQSREKQVDEIINNLSFKAPVGNANRLRMIIQLYLKDVRDEEQTREVLGRKEIEGGVGLMKDQVEEVMKLSNHKNVTEKVTNVPSLKSLKPTKKVNERLEKELPIKKPEAPFPAVSAPNNPFRHAPIAPKPIVAKTEVKPVNSREILESQTIRASLADSVPVLSKTFAKNEDFKISSTSVKPVMRDVSSAPIEVGPIDEIKYFNLIDFRRLSGNPNDAAKRLKQKFLNLKEESILMFFDAISAWHICPLYHDYIETVSEALERREPLAQVISTKNQIQISEIIALLEMEKDLN